MQFQTLGVRERPAPHWPDGGYLQRDRWDDFHFKTLWILYIVKGSQVVEIGSVKIANVSEEREPTPPLEFTKLPVGFYSLGQDEEYYENIKKLGPETRRIIHRSLRDVAYDLALFNKQRRSEAMRASLLRSVNASTVRTQYHRIAHGRERVLPFQFSYSSPEVDRHGDSVQPCQLTFAVDPESTPSSNVHVLVGSNGVGKSFILNDIASSLVRSRKSEGRLTFTQQDLPHSASQFSGLVSVAFSAFDEFRPLARQSRALEAIKYSYVGLRFAGDSDEEMIGSDTTPIGGGRGLKGASDLAREFANSLGRCIRASRLERWQRTLRALRSDPVLYGEILELLEARSIDNVQEVATDVFRRLSSGHKIVLLTITRLVENVDEATLVLLDEPESHLHPPLLSAFVRAVAQLVEERNGVAVIATHSPVVLQEVPRKCVWKLRSGGSQLVAERPAIETYAENVSTLTHDVFGLEVTSSGFYQTLREALEEVNDPKEILRRFDGSLGLEGRALLLSLSLSKGQRRV